jgi:tetratricopeptide (TPR) repeat protein
MKKVSQHKIWYLVLTVFSLFSCSEKIISPEETPEPETAMEDTVKFDDRPKRYAAGIEAMSMRDYPDAQRIFSEFVRNNPEMAGAYTNLALIHFQKQEYDEALKLANRAIDLNNRQPQAYNLRAQLMILNGKILEARDDYRKAIESNPDYANAQYNLALLYDVYLQDVKLALAHYEIYMSLIKQPDEATRDWVEHLKRTLNNG